jgi:hypothetical protein
MRDLLEVGVLFYALPAYSGHHIFDCVRNEGLPVG